MSAIALNKYNPYGFEVNINNQLVGILNGEPSATFQPTTNTLEVHL
jgi:hypothetical protein